MHSRYTQSAEHAQVKFILSKPLLQPPSVRLTLLSGVPEECVRNPQASAHCALLYHLEFVAAGNLRLNF